MRKQGFEVSAWLLLAAIAMPPFAAIAAEPEPSTPAPVAIPDTPAGRRLAWMIEALNAERLPQPDEVRGQFSPKSGDPVAIAHILQLAREAVAPVTLTGFREPPVERKVIAMLSDRAAIEHRLELRTDQYSGDRISDWWFGAPAVPGPDQFGVSAWDASRASPLPGAPIELLDGKTGEPLVPPQRCVGDFLGFCLFTLPREIENVAIRFTYRLLFSELDTVHVVPIDELRGRDDTSLAVFNRAWLEWSREASSAPVDSAKSSLSGTVVYYGASDRKHIGRAGCATVELEPRTRLLYTNLGPFFPDPERSVTDSSQAGWFVPELEPGTYVATARVGDRVGSIRLPRVEPGAHYVLSIPIYLSDQERRADLPQCD